MTWAVLASYLRVRALLAKEFRQLLRDPRMRFFVIVPPIVQLIIFGFAANYDVREADIAVVDAARSQEAREIVEAIRATGNFHVVHRPDMRSAGAAIDRGEVRAIVRFGQDFEEDRTVQIVADGSDSNSAQLVLGQLSRLIVTHAEMRAGTHPPVSVEERAWYNPNLDDRQYFVPGIIANVVLIATITLAAMTVVRERELGTLERLLVTPLGRVELLIGKMVPVACVGLLDVVLVTGMAIFGFDVPFRGSFPALLLGSVLYLASTLGLGMLISSYSTTQQQAVLLAVFFIMPAVILSGFAFPIENMPAGVQYVTYLDPVRYFIVVIRDLFLKGGGVADHLYEFGMMTLLGCAALALSALRIR